MQLKILKKTSRNSGFTLMEVMLVTIIVAIISGFALPNFSRAMNKARVRDAQAQLSAVYASYKILSAKNPTDPQLLGAKTIAQINADLGINLVSNGLTYNYDGFAGGFTATAAFPGVGGYTVFMNQIPINPLAASPNRNPCCTVGTCPGLGDC